jgi:hypothetical protein
VVDEIEAGLLLLGLVAAALAPLSYRLAVAGTAYWRATVRALVHLGRKPLAANVGLRLPSTIEGEREMWRLVAAFSFYSYDDSWASQLDSYREPGPATGEATHEDERDGDAR